MTINCISKIDITTSYFKDVICYGNFYVDKTKMIENFLSSSNRVHLIARHRRLGKTLNMDTVRCFLTDKEDLRYLFKGLYIEKSPVWEMAHSTPVFYFDFKTLQAENYKTVIYDMICENIDTYCTETQLSRAAKRYITSDDFGNANGFLYLTESVFRATGKRSYILIDEYDKLLMENYNKECYEEIRGFITTLFSSAVKSNPHLEKALLTGVMRISHESMFSGLNNIIAYDVFRDSVYKNDFGFTEEEIDKINNLTEFNISELRQWYNGVRIDGMPIYNTYSVMSYLIHKQYDCFWGKSGTMDIIRNLLNDSRLAVLARLLNGEQVEVPMADRVSLCHLSQSASDQAFYSLLVQAGYFALIEKVPGKISTSIVSIPNIELNRVWKEFILENLYPNQTLIRTLFDNINNPEAFAKDLQFFLQDRLSFHDLGAMGGNESKHIYEKPYHIFMLGLLSAYKDVSCKNPLSNRESGNGRYDILAERPDANIIFEFKACNAEDDLDKAAKKALEQITNKRYGEDLDNNKKLIKAGIAFYKKQVRVRCSTI